MITIVKCPNCPLRNPDTPPEPTVTPCIPFYRAMCESQKMAEDTEIERLRALLDRNHRVLNDLLALFVGHHGRHFNTVDDALDVLAANLDANPELPVTVLFAERVQRRREVK